jgi:tetratricopeptide (TPR) repeat protein
VSADAKTALDRYSEALKLQQAGQFAEAETIYRALLEELPNDHAVLNVLGVLLAQRGGVDEGAALLRRAIEIDPSASQYRMNLALAYANAGRRTEAAQAFGDLGNFWQVQGHVAESLAAYDGALKVMPNHAAILSNRGSALNRLGRYDEAIQTLRQALAVDPELPEGHNNLGSALFGQGKFEAAVDAFEAALRLRPDYPDALNNLGLALQQLGANTEAVAAIRRALQIVPDSAEAAVNLGNAFLSLRDLDQAVASYRRAIAARPDYALAHWNLALALLAAGRYSEGWREYEWRWRWPEFGETARQFAVPEWRGESPEMVGGKLLITAEQGLGDTIQFCRYLPLLARRGYRVIAEVQRPLHTLLWFSFARDGIAVIPRGETPQHIEGDLAFAAHAPLGSLPLLFGTEFDRIPAEVPYLSADPERVRRWRARLGSGYRVGIAWAGRGRHRHDGERSIDLESLAPLAAVPGVRLYSLQKGFAERAIAATGLPVEPLGEELVDLAETAAVMMVLDLVVTVDTAVAHLAGALGRRAWVLIPSLPDWRWLDRRADSPWYPTLRLYRQDRSGDWDEVIARIADDLRVAAGRF